MQLKNDVWDVIAKRVGLKDVAEFVFALLTVSQFGRKGFFLREHDANVWTAKRVFDARQKRVCVAKPQA